MELHKNPRLPRFYSNAQHVVLYHNHQPIRLGCVYPLKKAQALLARLNGIQNGFYEGLFQD